MDKVHAIEEDAAKKWNKHKVFLNNEASQVRAFYEEAVVFVTGASGFLGKHLLEKLLRTCNIKKVYVLLRTKKEKTAPQRLATILEDPLYELLRSEKPAFADILVPLQGDVSEINLGIDENTMKTLIKEVNVIFHAAATVNFGENVKLATLTNVRGTREMLHLARACQQLKSIVHVSTAYVQATKSRIRGEVVEDFYDCPLPPDTLIQLAESMDGDKLNKMIEPIMPEWPNSYTFTKAVTEELVRIMSDNLPLCVVRPAVVIAAYREPTPGWVDINNAYGPSGMILAFGLGLSHTIMAKQDAKIDFVPVDIVNNAIIVAAREASMRYSENNKQTNIYTVTSSRNPLYYRDLSNVIDTNSREIVTPKAVWYCYVIETNIKWVYLLLTWFLHYIPVFVADGCCIIMGKKTRFVKLFKKAYAISSAFEYFTNNDWIFCDQNTLQLYNSLSDVDKQIYNFDMKSVDILEMVFVWTIGIRKYIIRDGMKDTEYAIKKQYWLRIINVIALILYSYVLYKITYFMLASVYYIFYFILGCIL